MALKTWGLALIGYIIGYKNGYQEGNQIGRIQGSAQVLTTMIREMTVKERG